MHEKVVGAPLVSHFAKIRSSDVNPSRNASFQDMLLLAIRSLLANEGLPANGVCQPVDQDDDDVNLRSASSVIRDNREILGYYAKWTKNPAKWTKNPIPGKR